MATARFRLGWVISIALLFSILSIATARTYQPQPDEGVYANPGYNAAYNGHRGTTLYEWRAYSDESVRRITYWQFPLYFFFTEPWFRAFGFGLWQVRVFSICVGLIGLLSWNLIATRITGSATAGILAMALVAVDFFYLLSASTGRMDMLCCGFGAASLASYLELRGRSLPRALFWAHLCVTLSILAHPDGMLYWVGLVVLVAIYDAKSLSLRAFCAAAVPAAVGMALFGLYISQDPHAFLKQLAGNLKVNHESFGDTDVSSNPLIRSLQLEWRYRYRGPFGLAAGVSLVQRLKALVLGAFLVSAFGNLILARTRREKGLAASTALTAVSVLFLALASPSKFYYYLAHVTAFMSAGLGIFLFAFGRTSRPKLFLSAAVFAGVFSLQLAGDLYRIRQNGYRSVYLPMMAALRANTTPRSVIMGNGDVWFGLEHDRYVISDVNLGALSGTVPDVFVMDTTYRDQHKAARLKHPDIYAWEQRLLANSTLIFDNGVYQVYKRKAAGAV